MLSDQLRAAVRDVPDFPKPGILFRDITPILSHAELFRATADHLVGAYRDLGITQVVAIESRGFIFGGVLAQGLGAAFVPVRKVGKLPARTIQIAYDLEYGQNTLELHHDAIRPGDRVLIHDDLLATGGTVDAAVRLVEQLGGEVVRLSFLIELAFLGGRERLAPHPVDALVIYE